MSVILVRTDDRRMVYNQNEGWVDRDAGPGPTAYPDDFKNVQCEPGTEWEDQDDPD